MSVQMKLRRKRRSKHADTNYRYLGHILLQKKAADFTAAVTVKTQ